MKIIIEKFTAAILHDKNNFKYFDVEVSDSDIQDLEIMNALGPGALPAGKAEFWINADYVRSLADCASDAEWQHNFTKMLEAVRPYGWSNEDLTRIRVHVKRQ